MTAEMWDAVQRTTREGIKTGGFTTMIQNEWKGNFWRVVGLISMAALKPVGKTRHSSRFELPGNKEKQLGVRETTASG